MTLPGSFAELIPRQPQAICLAVMIVSKNFSHFLIHFVSKPLLWFGKTWHFIFCSNFSKNNSSLMFPVPWCDAPHTKTQSRTRWKAIQTQSPQDNYFIDWVSISDSALCILAYTWWVLTIHSIMLPSGCNEIETRSSSLECVVSIWSERNYGSCNREIVPARKSQSTDQDRMNQT